MGKDYQGKSDECYRVRSNEHGHVGYEAIVERPQDILVREGAIFALILVRHQRLHILMGEVRGIEGIAD